MALANGGPLSICGFLVFFVVPVVPVDDVVKLADFVLEMNGADFGVV